MKLRLQTPFLSIVDFPSVDLPSFTVVTGPNGAGKTHLLKAIQLGNVNVDSIRDPRHEARYVDWNTLAPQDSGAIKGDDLLNEREQAFQYFNNSFRQFLPRWVSAVRQLGFENVRGDDPASIVSLTADQMAEELNSDEAGKAAKAHLDNVLNDISAQVLNSIPNGDPRELTRLVATLVSKPVFVLKREDFSLAVLPSWGRTDIFQQSFGRLFVAYRELRLENLLKQLEQQKGRTEITALSDDEFTRKHMIPPWDFVNESFREAGLDFEIDHPDEFSRAPYEPLLRKKSTHVQIKFSELSSGEKILMSLALCLYYAQDNRQTINYPKLLLLDEVDATLHPSMCRRFMSIVTQTLVGRYGINVILATHSASTVALAPSDSVYVIHSSGRGLQKVTKSEALNELTVGVPTLAVSYDGRRQVFVESPKDAAVYDAIYQSLKPHLDSERSLHFVATGTKSKNGTDVNTGCAVVRRVVQELSAAGNTTTFGLIDWDGVNDPIGRTIVLAHRRRNGLENVVLDPLLIAAVIAREGPGHAADIGLAPTETYPGFLGFDEGRLQKVVEKVQFLVRGVEPRLTSKNKYVGGVSLLLDDDYLKIDDHLLEEMVLRAFPRLKMISRQRSGALMQYIAEVIMKDQPKFIPIELHQAFSILLDQPSHLESDGFDGKRS